MLVQAGQCRVFLLLNGMCRDRPRISQIGKRLDFDPPQLYILRNAVQPDGLQLDSIEGRCQITNLMDQGLSTCAEGCPLGQSLARLPKLTDIQITTPRIEGEFPG